MSRPRSTRWTSAACNRLGCLLACTPRDGVRGLGPPPPPPTTTVAVLQMQRCNRPLATARGGGRDGRRGPGSARAFSAALQGRNREKPARRRGSGPEWEWRRDGTREGKTGETQSAREEGVGAEREKERERGTGGGGWLTQGEGEIGKRARGTSRDYCRGRVNHSFLSRPRYVTIIIRRSPFRSRASWALFTRLEWDTFRIVLEKVSGSADSGSGKSRWFEKERKKLETIR